MFDLDREKALKDLFEIFDEIKGDDQVLIQLERALKKLRDVGRLEVVESDPSEDKEYGKIMGFYSSYENKVHVIIRTEDFDKKWFGLATDYDSFNQDSAMKIFHVFLHELCHYCAHNQTIGYRKIWNNSQKLLLQNTFFDLIADYGELFLPEGLANGRVSRAVLMRDANFNKAFNIYYEAIRRSDMVRMVNLQSLYSMTANDLYKDLPFKWARFFENVMIAAMEINYGDINPASRAVFKCLKASYLELWPKLNDSDRFNSLFYQELLYPSEIACIVVGAGIHNEDRRIKDLALRTLALI